MALPASAASAICSFLTGLDAISLSHTSSFWLQHLSVSSYWQSKLPTLADPLHAAAYKALFLRNTSFSFDVWFALLPEQTDGAYTGGILYGLQSVHAESRVWPKFHQQFVVISALGDLFCSVLDYRPVVKSNLQLRSDTGTLHREMDFLKYEQVGTGCITANELHFPKPGHLGWYGFHGVIDDFRVWRGLLSAEDVATLSSGEDVVEKHLISSLKVGTGSSRGLRWNVCATGTITSRCSRVAVQLT
ncbi:uncharacterized protein PITG_11556 [Phytophthora infestans T30-4]|uniref:F-box protein n=1 Tax=Phytophthora infestans (strain T30-4) TaxID=403677 RepID=D0NI09_PHYIT|nr:uncharacterized protein PITG_11556 [Phytophthora infestans T30-4]EEY59094.1 conserved hypothetical protein [Phytophthora infestans T30-4]|eukprot:XP_002901108.1 conserved hypothetical protein [Phytophthora infestans T30-4]